MAEVGLQRAGIVPVIGKLEPASVPQHVRVNLEGKPTTRPLNHAGKTSRAKGRSSSIRSLCIRRCVGA
jgi:hypothetical protein